MVMGLKTRAKKWARKGEFVWKDVTLYKYNQWCMYAKSKACIKIRNLFTVIQFCGFRSLPLSVYVCSCVRAYLFFVFFFFKWKPIFCDLLKIKRQSHAARLTGQIRMKIMQNLLCEWVAEEKTKEKKKSREKVSWIEDATNWIDSDITRGVNKLPNGWLLIW